MVTFAFSQMYKFAKDDIGQSDFAVRVCDSLIVHVHAPFLNKATSLRF